MAFEPNLGQRESRVIVVVGGGSAGHVVPALPVIDQLLARQWSVHFVGTRSGFEEKLLQARAVTFHGIAAGKLRRYLDWQNITDLGRIAWAVIESLFLLQRIKPEVVFSKGGFVSLPLVFAAWLLRVPVLAHESDLTPGLANRLASPFVETFCISFAETVLPKFAGRIVHTGTPIRPELLAGNGSKGRRALALEDKKILLITGGSLGADRLNQVVRAALPVLLRDYVVVHICGAGKVSGVTQTGYLEFEYVTQGWGDLLSAADCVISRAGANALFELLSLRKLNLLVPLSAKASRGDQIANAEYARSQGYSQVLSESALNAQSLCDALKSLQANEAQHLAQLAEFHRLPTIDLLVDEIEALA
jgi:UDP-N-acetylglucosamine--N-acetylmuramyl-(pentapeptide) pyrophosphoryl-undecaprenol N-acetylglucosamine transferase